MQSSLRDTVLNIKERADPGKINFSPSLLVLVLIVTMNSAGDDGKCGSKMAIFREVIKFDKAGLI